MSSSESEDMVNGYEVADYDNEDNGGEHLENRSSLEFEKLTDSIQKNCPEILRKFWEPVKAKEFELSSSRYVTKFGGSNPFRGNNFIWPRCSDKDCDRQKSFICQINLATIPDKSIRHLLKDFGLYQCFVCTNMLCSRVCNIFNDLEEPDHMRFIPKSEMIPSLKTLASFTVFESKADTDNLPKVLKEFVEKNNEQLEEYDENEHEYVGEEKQVKSWKLSNVKEVPITYEMMNADYKLSNRLLSLPGITEDLLRSINNYEVDDARPIATPQDGVKIGGYVRWFEENFHYSRCKDCELVMDIPFVQLAHHEDLQEFDWVGGSANIILCPGCGKPNLHWACNP